MKTNARGQSVTVSDPAPARVRYSFAHRDRLRSECLATRDRIAHAFAPFGEIAEMHIRPPDPYAWAEGQAAKPFARTKAQKGSVSTRRPYPLALVLASYPSWDPDPAAFAPLDVILADGRIVPGASDEAVALMGRARLWFKRMIRTEEGRRTRETILRSRRQEARA